MRKLALFVPLAVFLTAAAFAAAPTMTDYCQSPPFLSGSAAPNVFMVLDASGSMAWDAYMEYTPLTAAESAALPSGFSDYVGWTGIQTSGDTVSYWAKPYDSTKTYEGYFDPAKNYTKGATSGTWHETSAAATTHSSFSALESLQNKSLVVAPGAVESGSYLNYYYMSRIDVLRWALTGGTPTVVHGQACNTSGGTTDSASCDVSSSTFDPNNSASTPSSQVQCDANGCTLVNSSGNANVKARWDRLTGDNGGLLYQFKRLPIKPRIGILTFAYPYDGSNVMVQGGVTIARHQSAANTDTGGNPYKDTIGLLNAQAMYGQTPTGPALWAARAYFAQEAALFQPNSAYFDPQQGGGDQWRNPMYQCMSNMDANGSCSNYQLVPCAKNFIILLSDGQWNTNGSAGGGVTTCSIGNNYTTTVSNSVGNFSADPVKAAYEMHKIGFDNQKTSPKVHTNITTLYTLGLWTSGSGELALQNVALYGGFDTGMAWPDGTTGYPSETCNPVDCSGQHGKGSPCTPLPPSSPNWDKTGPGGVPDGIPDNYLRATDATQIKAQILAIVNDLLKKASSGTAVSVLGSSDGSGAFMLQTLFYPKRSFNTNAEIAWSSDLMNYWYYLDPYFSAMLIHEDTVREGNIGGITPPYTLFDLKQDYITMFAYDGANTYAQRYQAASGSGSLNGATDMGKVPIESSRAIWRAGYNLWWTKPSDRTVYTPFLPGGTQLSLPDGGSSSLMNFDTTPANRASLAPYLGQTAANAAATINYVRGTDCTDSSGLDCSCGTPGCGCTDASGKACVCGTSGCGGAKLGRNRTVTTNVCSIRRSPCGGNSDCPTGDTCVTETHVWKLGDIISSTPRPMGSGPLNSYNRPAPYGYSDQSYEQFVKSNDYQNRQLVFSGANDGMLHAFRLGKLLQSWPGKDRNQWWQVARLEGGTGPGGIGTEAYAFVPKNALPYLQYLQADDYCHIYMVDGPIALTDAAINKTSSCALANYWDCPKITTMTAIDGNDVDFASTSWRAVVVGSMGIGGATCSATATGGIRPPLVPGVSVPDVGWSSYFALDVTDQQNPRLLWEFSNPALGVTNVGAGLVRVGEKEKNGRWFAVLASGSTGPIANAEFQGQSNQTLKLFILDLKTGQLLRTIDTGIANAFAGSISSSTIDLQKDNPSDPGNYQDDVLYIGYVKRDSSLAANAANAFTQGGVIRLVINNNIDPAQWSWSKVFDDGVLGPVTSAVVSLIDRKAGKLWLYFGEGRYFNKMDDLNSTRRLFGVQEPCFDDAANAISSTSSTCGPLPLSALQDRTTLVNAWDSTKQGWYISLAPAGSSGSAERVVASPAIDPQGTIFFVTIAPNVSVCDFGGQNRTWAVDYKSGGTVPYRLQGKILIQTSTGEIKELDLSTAFSENDGRSSIWTSGTSTSSPTLVTNPPPVDRFMHIQEE